METTNQVRTEAAIYAEGTDLTTDDLMREWNSHLADCQRDEREPESCQRVFARVIEGHEIAAD